MADESNPADPAKQEQEAHEAAQTLASMAAGTQATVESEDESGDDDAGEAEHEGDENSGAASGAAAGGAGTSTSNKKKKKKKKGKKIRQLLTGKHDGEEGDADGEDDSEKKKKALAGLTKEQLEEFMKLNPALANELLAESKEHASGSSSGSINTADAIEALKQLKLQDIMTGLATSGKNRKDMGAYKFWKTQPVPQFGEDQQKAMIEEGPLKVQEVKDIPTEPEPLLLEQFKWVTVDLTNEHEMEEVYKLLNGHYVEDDEAMFRFKYSTSLLKWALMSPGWKKQWYIGIRSGNTLCAFIAAIPVDIRVRDKVLQASEVNFLCVHKKLRNKRLAPVLIKEITRVINLEGIWQAIYTGGIVLPRPVSTCRYFHRAINWQKLYEVGFSPCPANSKPSFQVRKYALPENTSSRGLREMEAKDIDAVRDLLARYLKRFDIAPEFSREDVEHWLLHKKGAPGEQVVWSYVVEGNDKKITDFFSFYCLESSVINNAKHSVIRAAYAFYYATEAGLTVPFDKTALKSRLHALFTDALILAKRFNFDVFNGLSLMDNALFLEDLKFGPGDGQLHYYLFNYKANPIHGGVDKKNQLDTNNLSGVGFVML